MELTRGVLGQSVDLLQIPSSLLKLLFSFLRLFLFDSFRISKDFTRVKPPLIFDAEGI